MDLCFREQASGRGPGACCHSAQADPVLRPWGNGGDLPRGSDCSCGEVRAGDRKRHLVLFGETIPLKNTWVGDIYDALTGGPTGENFTKGTSSTPIPYLSKQGPISLIPSICFEDTVGSITRSFVRDEPQVIINVTNDGWFGQSIASTQHAANAKFRCIELRRPMARAANTGVSGVFNMAGNTEDIITGETRIIRDKNGSPFVRDQLLATVQLPTNPVTTLYAIAGDWFCLLVFTLAVIFYGWGRLATKHR